MSDDTAASYGVETLVIFLKVQKIVMHSEFPISVEIPY